MTLDVTLFTDPACPFAFSAEPVRIRLRRHYGDGLRWTVRMIVLTREAGEAEKLAEWAGMPLATAEVALVMGTGRDAARRALETDATEHPAGADAYWTIA